MSYYRDEFDIERSVIPHDCRSEVYYSFFGKANVNYISAQITSRLVGVLPGKNIIVPVEKIVSVMDSIYKNMYRDLNKMTMSTISYITDYIKAEYEIEQQNNKLNIWVQSRPEEYGMQKTSKIKLREKRPTSFLFNMNY